MKRITTGLARLAATAIAFVLASTGGALEWLSLIAMSAVAFRRQRA